MLIRFRGMLFALTVLLCCANLHGDDRKKPAPSPSLPRYYRKLDLSAEQAAKVRKTWSRYREKIEELRKQIQQLQTEAAVELEKSLTDAQKARLKELQARGPGEFKLLAPQRAFSLLRGQRTTFSVELRRDDAFEGSIRLTVADVPRGVKIDPPTLEVKKGDNPIVEFKISADKDAEIGEKHFTIKATPEEGEPDEVKVQVVIKL